MLHVGLRRFSSIVALAYAGAAALALAIHLLIGGMHVAWWIEAVEDLSFLALSGILVGTILRVWKGEQERTEILEGSLKETSELLRAVVAGSPVAIFTLDEHGRVRSANPAGERIAAAGEQLVGPHDSVRVTRMIRECALYGTSFTSEEIVRERDGSRLMLSLSAAPLNGNHAHPRAVVALASDVTERRRSLDMLQRYRLMTEHLRDIVLFVGEDGRIVDANEAAVHAYGWTRRQLIGMRFSEISADLPGATSELFETEHVRADGTHLPVEVSTVRGEVDAEPCVLVVARTITLRRRRQSLERLLHEVDRRVLQNEPVEEILRFACGRVAERYGHARVQLRLEGHDALEIHAGADDSETLSSQLTLPLASHGRLLGTLNVFSPGNEECDPDTRNLLVSFADQIALSLLAARDQEQIALQTVALESAANAVVLTEADGTIKWVNPAFERLTGYAAAESIGARPSLLKSGNHSPAFYRQMWETLLRGEIWSGEMWNRRKDGTLYVEEQTITPVRSKGERISHFVAIKQDVTARRRHEDQIRHLAMHDALTDLPNRRALDGILERVMWSARRGSPGVVMMIDVDNFKPVNDTLGHLGGDQLLAELARLMRCTLRPGDFLARLGGDEFAVVLQDTSLESAQATADRLRAAVASTPFRFGDRVFDLTISVGISSIDAATESSAAMVQADSAMYSAKDAGKNRIVAYPFGEAEGRRSIEAGRWAARIRDALREQRFMLCYQPVVRLGNGEAEHYEALIRMIDRDGSQIPPEQFISAAERFGLMPQIDRWVVDHVVNVLSATEGGARVFVNISGASLGDAALLDFIEQRIVSSKLPPGRLAFEITESAAIRDLTAAQSWIRKLKDRGCLFAIDDFGVGFSSFSYLRALSADYVKIDRSFVSDVDVNPTNRALVRAVMTVAQTLGKEVIAEGVETDAHAAALIELGVELAQGYRWGFPLVELLPQLALA
jgi:diguanylate cyclase (GGDEF)-like protein/PAS domain S-box-containing protein